MDNCKLVIIIILLLVLLCKCLLQKSENFEDKLSNLDLMDDKIDSLVDQEKETRTFCKLLRHDSSNKEHLHKVLEQRNIEFSNNWKKQNKMLSDIKKKLINIKLGKNNKEFAKFNDSKNNKRDSFEKRRRLMEAAKKTIKQKPAINLTFNNNI